MKRFFAMGLLAIVACGCYTRDVVTSSPEDDNTIRCRKVTFEGHDYLVFKFRDYSGTSAMHSESCPCRRKAEKQ